MKKLIITILILLCAGYSAAFEKFSNVAIHGFISQGYLITTENDYFFSETQDGTFQFNEMGLNFGTNMTDSLRMSIQFLAKDLGMLGNDEVTIDYAMADYNYRDWLGLRAGKIKKPMGLYNQSRDVDAGRCSIFLPQSIYFEAYRDQALAIKGIGLYGRLFGQLDYQATYGVFDIESDSGMGTMMQKFYHITPLGFDIDPSIGLNILWETPLEDLSLGATITTFDFSANISETVAMKTSGYQPIISLQFMHENFMFSAEYEWHTTETSFSGIDYDTYETDFESYYAMMSYRFADWFQIGGGYAVLITDKDNSDLAENFFKDMFLSIRFDINDYWIFKLEGHGVNGLVLVNDDNPEKNWQIFAAKLTYSF